MMVRWFAALLLLALALLTGCARMEQGGGLRDETVELQLQLPENPTVGTPSTLEVRLLREGAPVTGATIEVEGAMSHAGMEPLLVEATEVGQGEYEAMLDWSMGGEWIITAHATLPDGALGQSQQTVEVISP